MAATKRPTVIAVFQERRQADLAVAELQKAGFPDEHIGLLGKHVKPKKGDPAGANHATDGAVAGVLTGAGVGGLVGLGVLAGVIPPLGPAIAAGALGAVLLNAAGVAAVGGVVGGLVGMGIPEKEAQWYENELKAGRYIVTVRSGGNAAAARTILRRHDGYDFRTPPGEKKEQEAEKAPAKAAASNGRAAKKAPAKRRKPRAAS